MLQQQPVTVKGFAALQEELHHLKSKERPRIIEEISDARAHGDLKENAEYHAAREQQAFIEGRIQDIEQKLSRVQIIDIQKMPNTGRVLFGTTVTILDLDTDQSVIYQIVGEDEADIRQHKLSYLAPLARQLMGKEVGETIEVQTPMHKVSYEILAVEHQ